LADAIDQVGLYIWSVDDSPGPISRDHQALSDEWRESGVNGFGRHVPLVCKLACGRKRLAVT
jgi:hypothetical protein